MSKLVYIGFAFQHHKKTHAGYHHVRDYVKYDYIVDCQNFIERNAKKPKNIFERAWRYVMRRIVGFSIFPFYLLRIIQINRIEKEDIVFHFIYGENLYTPLLRKVLHKRNKIVCTFHQPYEWFVSNSKGKKWLDGIDKIILVSNNEIPLFESLTGKQNVVYIPHGICTDFYSLNKENVQTEEISLLTVGNWLRDYSIANEVYMQLLKKYSKIKIYVVASSSNTEIIKKDSRIKCLTGISDEYLRQLYWNCNVLYLPLIRYTANNALLESAACGCNIVVASTYSENSYIPQRYIRQVGLNVHDSVRAIEETFFQEKNALLSKYVDTCFSWQIVGQEIESFLKNI